MGNSPPSNLIFEDDDQKNSFMSPGAGARSYELQIDPDKRKAQKVLPTAFASTRYYQPLNQYNPERETTGQFNKDRPPFVECQDAGAELGGCGKYMMNDYAIDPQKYA